MTLRANLSFYFFKKKFSPEIIRYGAFYISLKELVDSMKPVQWLSKIVIETGILHIMESLLEGSKKVVMPLRFSVSFSKTLFLPSSLFCSTFFVDHLREAFHLLRSFKPCFIISADKIIARDPQCE